MDDSWADIFTDAEARTAEYLDTDSDDSGFTPRTEYDLDAVDESEEEDEAGPAIQHPHTQHLCNCRTARLVDKIQYIFEVMDPLSINLTIFLDAVSWGDGECMANSKIHYERSGLMKSDELPQILHHWWRPPRRSSTSNKKHASAASDVMEKFLSECFREVVDQELHAVGSVFCSPAGNDVKEETLTGFSFKEVIPSVQHLAPNLWSVLHGLAYTKSQITRKSSKNPEKVEYTVALLKLKCNSDNGFFFRLSFDQHLDP
jgi:hypothetical protein